MRLPHPFLERIETRAALRRAGDWMEARARRGICFSQNDMSVGNSDGATVRADINSALQALASNSSGATAPATTYAYQTWYDTTTNTRKRRNAANSGWHIMGSLDEVFVVDRSSNTIWDESDFEKVYRITGSYTQTVTAVATLGDGWHVGVRIESGFTLTIDPNGTENINGASASLAIIGPAEGEVWCNGSALYTTGFDRSGVYTPTLTNTTNLDGSTASQCQWSQTGNVVTVSGMVSMNPTAAGSVVLGMTLPVASNIGAEEDLGGVAHARAIADGAAIFGDAANNRATIQYIATDTANRQFSFAFQYRVLP